MVQLEAIGFEHFIAHFVTTMLLTEYEEIHLQYVRIEKKIIPSFREKTDYKK